jgi:hypothetical protein
MRKFLVAGIAAALGGALLATPASAIFDHHFSVIAKTRSVQRVSQNKFRFKDVLKNPRNQHDRVGRDRGTCKRVTRRSLHCHARVHLNGDIGGFGDILVRGDLERHDNRVNVVGGTDDFDGVAGKMLIRTLTPNKDKLHFDLVR